MKTRTESVLDRYYFPGGRPADPLAYFKETEKRYEGLPKCALADSMLAGVRETIKELEANKES